MHKYEFVVVVRNFSSEEKIYDYHDFECNARSLFSAVNKMYKHFRYFEIFDYSVNEVY